jgi:hypothetical protein
VVGLEGGTEPQVEVLVDYVIISQVQQQEVFQFQ